VCAYLLEAGRRKRWRRVELQAETESARGACLDLLSGSVHSRARPPNQPPRPRVCSPQRRRRQQQQQPLAAGSRRRAPCTQIIPSPPPSGARRKAKERHKCLPPDHPPRYMHPVQKVILTRSLVHYTSYIHTYKHPCLPVYMQFILLRATPVCAQDSREPKERALYSLYYVCGFFPALSSSSCAQVEIKIPCARPGEVCDRRLDPFQR
jgi:hypothetical protein